MNNFLYFPEWDYFFLSLPLPHCYPAHQLDPAVGRNQLPQLHCCGVSYPHPPHNACVQFVWMFKPHEMSLLITINQHCRWKLFIQSTLLYHPLYQVKSSIIWEELFTFHKQYYVKQMVTEDLFYFPICHMFVKDQSQNQSITSLNGLK